MQRAVRPRARALRLRARPAPGSPRLPTQDADVQSARGKDNLLTLLFGDSGAQGAPAAGSPAAASSAAPVDQDAERVESAKAATISAVAGSVAALPLTLVQAVRAVASATAHRPAAVVSVWRARPA